MTWKACNNLNKIWKSNLSKNIKIKLFQATMESVLLYGSDTWTVTKKISKALDGCYTRMLRATLDISWKSHITNKELYGDLPKITAKLPIEGFDLRDIVKEEKGTLYQTSLPDNQHRGKEQQEDLQKHMLTNYKQTQATQLGR